MHSAQDVFFLFFFHCHTCTVNQLQKSIIQTGHFLLIPGVLYKINSKHNESNQNNLIEQEWRLALSWIVILIPEALCLVHKLKGLILVRFVVFNEISHLGINLTRNSFIRYPNLHLQRKFHIVEFLNIAHSWRVVRAFLELNRYSCHFRNTTHITMIATSMNQGITG